MKVFRQGSAPAAQFDEHGRMLWSFNYSEEVTPTPGAPYKDRLLFKTDDPSIQAQLLQAGAVEVVQ